MWRSRDRKHIIVGYLVPDTCCENPLADSDSMGKIVHRTDMDPHLGLETHEPDLEPYLDYLARLAGEDIDDPTNEQTEAAIKLWIANYKAFKTPSTWARALRQHGRDCGVYECDVDDIVKGRADCAWVPDAALYDHINSFPPEKRNEEAYKCFVNAIEEFNRWAEGECYGIVIEYFVKKSCGHYHKATDEPDSSCWGYIGNEWALVDLRQTFKWAVNTIRRKNLDVS